VHAVEAAQEGALAAAGSADQRGDLVFRHDQIDILQGLVVAVVKTQFLHLRLEIELGGRLLATAG
jgi:hypothetical protein